MQCPSRAVWPRLHLDGACVTIVAHYDFSVAPTGYLPDRLNLTFEGIGAVSHFAIVAPCTAWGTTKHPNRSNL